jgi:hypothetical protein
MITEAELEVNEQVEMSYNVAGGRCVARRIISDGITFHPATQT